MTAAISIRKAGTEDVPATKTITDAAYAKWIPLIGRPPAPMLSDHSRNVIDHNILLADLNGMPVAVLELIVEDDCLFIENLAVHPDNQGCGIALEILDHAEQLCRAAGFKMLRLLTNRKFEANIAFYKKRGFVAEYESEYKGGIAVHMMKRIA